MPKNYCKMLFPLDFVWVKNSEIQYTSSLVQDFGNSIAKEME